MMNHKTNNIVAKAIKTSLAYALLMGVFIQAKGQDKSDLHTSIQNQTTIIFDSLVAIRRDLYQHPEPAGQEKRTAAQIERYLLGLGLEVKTNIGGYGVVGILQGGKKGKKVAWRADIDALPFHSHESSNFASETEGVSHQCGHDVHTTIALGMANVLANHRESLEGTVYFIFQPSEENYLGAKAMLADELFDVISPDEIFAAHISPMPVGLVASKPHYLYADYKQINISFESGQNESLILFTQNLISDLQNVAPDSKFWDTRNLMDPNIGIGNPNTIFKNFITVTDQFSVSEKDGQLTISGIISASNQALIDSIPPLLKEQISKSPHAKLLKDISYGSKHLIYSNERGNIDNDPEITTQSIQSISKIYGPSSAISLYGTIPDGRGDDFSYFQEKVPGTYFLIGGSNFAKGIIAMPHAPNFAVDEECIKAGVNYFSSMIVERLAAQ